MSLINEALKRAREEAARQEAERQGTFYSSAPRHLPNRRRGPFGKVIGIGVAVVALLLAGWWLGRLGTEEPEAPAEIAQAQGRTDEDVPTDVRPADAAPTRQGAPADLTADERDVAPGGSSEPEAQAVPGSAVTPNPVATDVATSPTDGPVDASDTESVPPAVVPQTVNAPATAAARPDPPAPVSSAPRSVESNGEAAPNLAVEPPASTPESSVDSAVVAEARRELTTSSGATLRLSGIAFSADRPMAILNGEIRGVGERVEGYTLESIEPNLVTLRGSEGVYRLHLHESP